MGFTAFIGNLLLGLGPLITIYVAVISPKSFLVLLSLGSAFYWLVTLFVISSLFRGFAPLSSSIGPYVGLTLVAVLLQELARLLLWRLHLKSVRVLEHIAREHVRSSLKTTDHFSLSLTHGLSHATVHALFFFVSWLPLSLGDGTLYLEVCPKLSFYLIGSLTTLCFSMILTSAMVVCFEALETRSIVRGIVPSIAHLAAALVTLINFSYNGCYVSLPLLFAEGVAMSVWAYRIWWQRTGEGLRITPSSQRQD